MKRKIALIISIIGIIAVLTIGIFFVSLDSENQYIIERQKIIGKWITIGGNLTLPSDHPIEVWFKDDGTLLINQTAYHYGMGVSYKGYKIYEGTWDLVEKYADNDTTIMRLNSDTKFVLKLNYTLTNYSSILVGLDTLSSFLAEENDFLIDEEDGQTYMYIAKQGVYGSQYQIKLEKLT